MREVVIIIRIRAQIRDMVVAQEVKESIYDSLMVQVADSMEDKIRSTDSSEYLKGTLAANIFIRTYWTN